MNDFNIKNSHDKLFKDTWSDPDNAKSFLKNYLPKKVLDLTNLDSLEICKDSFIEKNLEEYYSDMLYKADIKGSSGYIYLLFEHKSYYDKWIHLQLLEYLIKIWRQDIKNNNPANLPIIIPMVLYHGRYKWTAKTEFSSLFINKTKELNEFLPDFKFILYDLNSWSDNEIKGSVFTKAVLLLLKHIFSPDLQNKLPEVFSLFKDLSESQTGLQYLESLIRYLLSNVENIGINDLKSIVSNAVDQNKGDMVMTIAERLRQTGRC